jgi:hypothetical protein
MMRFWSATMLRSIESFSSLEELAKFIWISLAKPDRLDLDQVDRRIAPVRRGEALTSWEFLLEGPRRLRMVALWLVDTQQILFYDSTGKRFRETRLMNSPHGSDMWDTQVMAA